MKNTEIKNKVEKLIKIFVSSILEEHTKEIKETKINDMLNLIISDSIQAISFIVLLEDEFEIEIDDDDISLDFFKSIDAICLSIANGLEKKLNLNTL